ncbi:MAG: hypothetical protein ABW169_11025 [Sphingobium sp.]
MNERHQLIAYLATLGALIFIIAGLLVAAAMGVEIDDSFGVSIAIGGLIGVLRIPSQRSVTVDNSTSDPVPTQPQP